MILRPMPFVWSAGAFVPDLRFVKLAERQFKAGQRYVLIPREEASYKERARYHAAVREAHNNLSDEAKERYPTATALRKWALVKAEWCKKSFQVCDTKDEALRLAAIIRGMHDYDIVTVSNCVVTIYRPDSQRVGPGFMTLEEWRQSVKDVLDVLSGTIGVSRKALEKEGKINAP